MEKMRFERTIYLIAGSLKEWNASNLKIQMKLKRRFMIMQRLALIMFSCADGPRSHLLMTWCNQVLSRNIEGHTGDSQRKRWTYFLPASSRCPARPGRRWACGWQRTRTWRRWWTACPDPPPGCPETTPATTGLRHHSWNRNDWMWENLDWPELICLLSVTTFLYYIKFMNLTTSEIYTKSEQSCSVSKPSRYDLQQ